MPSGRDVREMYAASVARPGDGFCQAVIDAEGRALWLTSIIGDC